MLLGRMLELSRYGLINCFTLRRLNPPTKWFSFFTLLLLLLYLPSWYLCHFFNFLCSYPHIQIHEKESQELYNLRWLSKVILNMMWNSVPDDAQSLLCPEQLFCSPISVKNAVWLWNPRSQNRHFPDPQLVVHLVPQRRTEFSCYCCCLLLPLSA